MELETALPTMANEIKKEVDVKTEGDNFFSNTLDSNEEVMADHNGIITRIKIEEVLVKIEVEEDEDKSDPAEFVPCSIKVENLPELPLYGSDDSSEGTDDSKPHTHNSRKGAKARYSQTKSKGRANGETRGRKRKKSDGTLLSGKEKAKRYRERLKSNPEKFAERLRKKRENYHKTKKLVSTMEPQEKKEARSLWKCRKQEQRLKKETVVNYANWFTSQTCGIEPFIW